MQLLMINFAATFLLAVLLLPRHLVAGLPLNNNNSIDPPQTKDQIVSLSKESSESGPTSFSVWFGSSEPGAVVTRKPSKAKKPRMSSLESTLGCQNFVCLLSKFDLLKTDTGYVLTPFVEFPAADSTPKKSVKVCKRFDCWLSQFRSKQKSYGWELTFKSLPEDAQPKVGNPSLEPDWSGDIIGDLMMTKHASTSTSSQSNPQKSPIFEFDSLFAKT